MTVAQAKKEHKAFVKANPMVARRDSMYTKKRLMNSEFRVV